MQNRLEALLNKDVGDIKISDSSGRERLEFLQPIRDFIKNEQEKIKKSHYSGASGMEIGNANAALVDNVIKNVYLKAEDNFRRSAGDFYTSCVILAVGGYGRGTLNPFSDIDILFLYKRDIDKFIEAVAKDTLALLWDIGFEVGHSVRSIDNCLEIAGSDLSSKTAMLESRYIKGNESIYMQFVKQFHQQVIKQGITAFIKGKKEEMERRINAYKTIYLTEPNVKDGIGGLRDFHTAVWIASAKFGINSIEGLLRRGIIDNEEAVSAAKGVDFLMRIRNYLHFIHNKKSDVLTHHDQLLIAKEISGQDKRQGLSDVEQFMCDYYMQTTNINRFSVSLIKRCENYGSKQNIIKRRGFLSKYIGDGFTYYNKEIYVKGFNPSIFEKSPVLLIKIFLYCQEYDLELSESVKRLIKDSLNMIDKTLIKSKETGLLFASMFKKGEISCVLRMMHETGVLRRYIKEFDDISYMIHNNIYHKYTIDEHTFKAVEICEGILKKEDSDFKKIYLSLSKPEIVKLALLLHDIGKGDDNDNDHATSSAVKAKEIILRLKLGRKMADEVSLLVRNHLLMNYVAQRRDINDIKTISEFALSVGNIENLKMLYLVTYADIAAVGPDIWSPWKASLIRELYNKTFEYLTRDETEKIPKDALIGMIKEDITEALISEIDEEFINKYFDAMPDKYMLSTIPSNIIEHIKLYDRMRTKPLVVKISNNKEMGFYEVMVCTAGRTGLLSKIAGTLTSKNLNIIGAQVYTRDDGIAIDTINVVPIDAHLLIEEDNMAKKIESDLFDVLEGKKDIEALINSRYKYAKPEDKKKGAVKIEPHVIINNDISDTHTVIEVINEDVIGVLYKITNEMCKLELDIYLAKISIEANKGINAFYVTDLTGRKITDQDFIEEINRRIQAIL